MEIPAHCTLCPRRCGADRRYAQGFCGGGAQIRLARAALHFWEEPCISGTRGSGTVFFSGCALQCCYCQNYEISAHNFGKEISIDRLAKIFLDLQAQGAHNINLVTPGHYLPWILHALTKARPTLHIPVVYNTGGYETSQAIAALNGFADVYLTDLKYVSSALSAQYSGAPDYFQVVKTAIQMMIAQVGPPVYGEDGTLARGVIIRHLALPGAVEDSFSVLNFMANELPAGSFHTSIMSQYTPLHKAFAYKPLRRRISSYEYRRIVNHAVDLGLCTGFMQEKSSAREEYTPPFDLQGIE